jgi:hypothetical protein
VAADITSYRTRASEARKPEEFAYRAGCKKFGLRLCDESIEFVSRYIGDGLTEIAESELSDVVNQTAEFVGQWLRHVPVDEGGN